MRSFKCSHGAALIAALALATAAEAQQSIGIDNPLRTGENQQAAVRVNDAIFLAYGFGNTFMVTTSAGNVIIDTSSVVRAPRARELLQRESKAPAKYIVLTHGHGDHTGGVNLWKEPDTHLTEVALTADPKHRAALETRLKALEALRAKSKNSNERGWLDYHLRLTRTKLAG